MILVKTFLDKSKIHGIGLFAGQNIKEGHKIYKWSPIYDIILTKTQFNKLHSKEKKLFKHYGYLSKWTGKWHITSDDLRFCNHSNQPSIYLKNNNYYALRNIKKGEEITCDYREFENLRSEIK